MLSMKLDVKILSNQQFTTTGGSTAAVDVTPYEGEVFLTISDRAGGTAAATVTVEHSEVEGSGYTAVPAGAIYDINSGEASAFPALDTNAYHQQRGLMKQRLKRYLRVTIAGTGITHNVAVAVVGQPKYTEVAS